MIEKMLFWNIRSINIQNSFERLIDLNRRNKYSYIALIEPFRDPSQIEKYKRRLGFTNVAANCSGNIWCFWSSEWDALVVMDTI